MLSISQANMIVDMSAENNQKPIFVENNDALTIINIQAANTAGISHNKYTQFDVDVRGVVLNNFVSAQPGRGSIESPLNSHVHDQTLIGSNEFLRGSGSARVILNEVTSLAGPSQLNGPIAVVGQKADVIIANPAGIECNGCGFINTGIANLSAANPLLVEGSIKFSTDNIHGEITFSGAGLSKEANQSDYTTLIADKIKINAPVYANKGLYANLSGDKGSMHTASLNISELGGMYADKISIRGTGQNIGVHNKGEIKTNAGLVLQISGLLDSPGVISSSEYFDINSENFNITFDKDETYSLACITDNMIFKENTQGVRSEKQSIMQDFSPKPQSVEQDKIKEINSIKKSKNDMLKHEYLPAQNKYMKDLDELYIPAYKSHLFLRLISLEKITASRDNYLMVKNKYENIGLHLYTQVAKLRKLFAISDYSYYQNMSNQKINNFIISSI